MTEEERRGTGRIITLMDKKGEAGPEVVLQVPIEAHLAKDEVQLCLGSWLVQMLAVKEGPQP